MEGKMFRIRRFNVIKTSNVAALIYMVVTAIFVIPFALLFAIAGTATQIQGGITGGIVFAVVAIFGYGLLGWVFTAIACLIYNLVASWIGGIEVQVEAVAPPPPPPSWMPPASPTSPAPPPTQPPPPPSSPPTV
jgi:hypothetical protein